MVRDFVSEKKPMALFMITRDESPQTYSTVVSSFVDMIYTRLIDLAHVLIGNAQNLVYMSSTDMDLVEMISR